VDKVIPQIVVKAVNHPRWGTRLIVLECPYCGEQHEHGYTGKTENSYGLRESHCYPGGTYEMVEKESE
jgi:hypothetical protein